MRADRAIRARLTRSTCSKDCVRHWVEELGLGHASGREGGSIENSLFRPVLPSGSDSLTCDAAASSLAAARLATIVKDRARRRKFVHRIGKIATEAGQDIDVGETSLLRERIHCVGAKRSL